jgi:hypothetical protein
MSSEAYIASPNLGVATAGSKIVIPLDLQRVAELFNALRPRGAHSSTLLRECGSRS